jgi:hypothetical protein
MRRALLWTSACALAFVGSVGLAAGQQPSPPLDAQQQSQQENAQQTPSGKMGKEEPSSHAPSAQPTAPWPFPAHRRIIELHPVPEDPWLERVLPNIVAITSGHPSQTIFTRFIPAQKPGQGMGMWQHYYKRWGSMTIDQLGPDMIGGLFPTSLPSFRPLVYLTSMSIRRGLEATCISS